MEILSALLEPFPVLSWLIVSRTLMLSSFKYTGAMDDGHIERSSYFLEHIFGVRGNSITVGVWRDVPPVVPPAAAYRRKGGLRVQCRFPALLHRFI